MTAPHARTNRWLALAGFIALCLAVGVLAGWATSTTVADWYPTLAKPSWTPPPAVFAPMWTVLYPVMAIAAWLVWKKDSRFAGVRAALILFYAQLALNLAWPFLFFGLRSPLLGLIDIAALLVASALTVRAFFNQSRLAGLLMLPYLAWVAFATALNLAILELN